MVKAIGVHMKLQRDDGRTDEDVSTILALARWRGWGPGWWRFGKHGSPERRHRPDAHTTGLGQGAQSTVRHGFAQ
jgi:hypothetical protein